MDFIKVFRVDVSEAEGFIPPSREAVERDLSSNAIGQVQICKLLLHGSHHVLSNVMFQIKLFVIISFFPRAVPTDWRDVEHATSELKESPTLLE